MNPRQYEPIFGSWKIEEEIGSGSEGSLYKISRTDALGKKYYSALKCISVPSSESETASLMAGGMSLEEVAAYYESVLENTTQEFELLVKLKGNSNIVSYEDHEIFRHENGIGWDILIRLEELIPLVKYSIDNPLSADDVCRLGRDICRGLSLCKKYGIVHRDIKPDNIFLSPSGSYKLGDFGISRIIENTTFGLSRKGTYEYMAPEVYWGRAYGPTVDLYSLGMVMYRYLNDGRMPFLPQSPQPIQAGDRENAVIKRVSGNELPPPHHGSEELKRIVLKACEYESKNRYRDADEMLHDLEALVSGKSDSLEAGAKVKTRQAKSPSSRRGLRAALIAVAACLVIGIGVWALIPKEVTDIEAGNIEGSAEIYYGDSLTAKCSVKPDWFKDEPVKFTSGDESVFTVSKDGTIQAVSPGKAALTMTAKEYTEKSDITVVPKVTSIEGVEKEISLTTGDTLALAPTLLPKKFAGEKVSYKSGDKNIFTISEDGTLTAVSAGEAKLTIESGGCTFKSSVTVSDPVVYYAPSTSKKSSSGSSGSSKSSNKSNNSGSSKKASKGYFDSGDDEHF